MAILDILRRLAGAWSTPRTATHRGEITPLELRCSLEEAPATSEAHMPLPAELAEFWRDSGGARLFEDTTYGQWGLVLLGRDAAADRTEMFVEERLRDARPGDLVVGEFLGDQDLLLVRCDQEASDFGSVLVALPLDGREDWYVLAPSLTAFLEEFEQEEGAKYWEET